MPNKDYTDDFFYEYTPKHLKEELDPDRDLSSFSKPSATESKPAPSRKTTTRSTTTAPAKRTAASSSPRRTASTTTARRTTKPASKGSDYLKTGEKIAKGVINKYGEVCMAGLGTIIKVIAFIVGFSIIIGALLLGIVLFSSKSGLSALSLLVIIGGVVLGALFFFPIYGIGHIICQNNEILRIFTNETEK